MLLIFRSYGAVFWISGSHSDLSWLFPLDIGYSVLVIGYSPPRLFILTPDSSYEFFCQVWFAIYLFFFCFFLKNLLLRVKAPLSSSSNDFSIFTFCYFSDGCFLFFIELIFHIISRILRGAGSPVPTFYRLRLYWPFITCLIRNRVNKGVSFWRCRKPFRYQEFSRAAPLMLKSTLSINLL